MNHLHSIRTVLLAASAALLCGSALAQTGPGPLGTPSASQAGAARTPKACATQYCSQPPTSVLSCFPTLSACDETLLTGSWDLTNVPRSGFLAGTGDSFGIWIYNNTVVGQSTFITTNPCGYLCLPGFKRTAGPITNPICKDDGGLFIVPHPGWVPFVGDCATTVHSVKLGCASGALGLSVGDDVNVQAWMRDPVPFNLGNCIYSNAIHYTIL